MTPANALWLCEKFACISVLLSSVEILCRRHGHDDGSLSSWQVQQLRFSWFGLAVVAPILDALFRYPNIVALHAARAVLAAILLCSSWSSAIAPWAAVGVIATHFLFCLRNQFGWDGADQMAVIVLSGVTVGRLPGTDFAMTCALWFIAAQSILAYLTAGVCKALSPVWRREPALVSVLATRSYGMPKLARRLSAFPAMGTALGWFVFCWEMAFPLLLLTPRYAGWILATGVLFHLGNAVLMGLDTFFWSFVATYPALLFCSAHPFWRSL